MGEHVSHRHHYVPRFLLAGFTPSGEQADFLYSFATRQERPERRTPMAVAREHDYYAVEVEGQPTDFVETFFGRVETTAAPIIKAMVADRALPTGQDFADLMFFLALMFGGAPALRETVVGFYEQEAAMMLRIAASSPGAFEAATRGMPPEKRPTYEQAKRWAGEEKPVEVANPSGVHAKFAIHGLDIAPRLLWDRQWSLAVAREGAADFVSSDNPVSLLWSDPAMNRFGPPGLGLSGSQFLLAIHRRAALIGQFEGPSGVHEVDSDFVAGVNGRTLRSARRRIYAADPDFVFLDHNRRRRGAADWLGRDRP